MTGIVPAPPIIVQDVRAQAVASLIAMVDGVNVLKAVRPHIAEGRGDARLVQGSLPANAAIAAKIIENPQASRILLAIEGKPVELELSAALQRLASRDPALLATGKQVILHLNARGTRVVSVEPSAQNQLQAATVRSISSPTPQGASVTQAAPPLASPFPAGSVGATLARLSGLAFPLAERGSGSTGDRAAGLELHSQLRLARTGVSSSNLAGLPPTVAEAALIASVRQGPVSAAITALLAGSTNSELTQQIAALARLRLDATGPSDPSQLREAIRQSGIFLEARIAQIARTGTAAQLPLLPGNGPENQPVQAGLKLADLKSTLLTIRALLANPPPESPAILVPQSIPKTHAHGGDAPAAASSSPQGANQPAPSGLLPLVEGAIERIRLSQIASLPDHPEIQVTDDRGQGMRIATSIPIATLGMDRPQTAMIGLVIEHQPQPEKPEFEPFEPEAGGAEQPFPWKVRIAVDLEETGPVQAEIGLRGQAISVTLWAKRKAMAGLARAEIGALHQALTEAAFDVTRLEVKDGCPLSAPNMRLAPKLDRRS